MRFAKALEVANQFAEGGDVAQVKRIIEPLLEQRIRNLSKPDPKAPKPRFLFNLVLKAFANAGDFKGAEAWYDSYKNQKAARSSSDLLSVNTKTFGKLVKSAAKAGEAHVAEAWLWRQFNEVEELRRMDLPKEEKEEKLLKDAHIQLEAKQAENAFSQRSRPPSSSFFSSTSLSEPQLISVVDAFAKAGDAHRSEAWLQRLRLLKESNKESKDEHFVQDALKAQKDATSSITQKVSESRREGKGELKHLDEFEWKRRCGLEQKEKHNRETVKRGDEEVVVEANIAKVKKDEAQTIKKTERLASGEECQRGRDNIDSMDAGHIASLMAWANLGDLRKVALCVQTSKHFGQYEWNALLIACAKSTNPSKAREYFQLGTDLKLMPCSTAFTSLIDAYARSQNGQEAEKCVLTMLKQGVGLDSSVGASLLNSWVKCEVGRIEAWMRRLLVAEVCLDCVVYTNLISACAYAGELQRAEACLEEMEAAEMQTNVVTHTAVLQAHLQSLHGCPERVMERMLGFDTPEKRPNALTFGLLIGALASRGDISGAERWYACMRRNLKDVDLVAHNAVISASARAHDAQRARLWFGRMKTANLTGDGMSLNSTLDPVARGVDVAVLRSEALEAEWLCDELDPAGLLANEITFSILMRPWALMGDLPNVDRLWQKMQKQGLQPKACNFWAVLTACAHSQPPQPDTAAQRYEDSRILCL
ncbi:unnamed protein product [Durusdinium trenchii]|uniref:Pentatricopeptide repeat-containing protein n=1 Tax=Durusdinium trenchii TaxID=1381693 RepID=A0ABP0IB29_9DINO